MTNVNDVQKIIEWNKNRLAWIDFADFSPRTTYWVKLADGREMRAVFVYGEWESLDGRQLSGVKQWQVLSVDAVTFK